MVLYTATIFVLSSRSNVPLPRSVWRFDKLLHAIEYAGLAMLSWRALRLEGFRQAARWAVLGSSVFGLSDELHQLFTPGRSAEALDWVADTVGALAGVGLLVWWRRTQSRRNGGAALKP
ncbi:MAG: VanZ family protein [Myxococcaceae bacterium]|nr:VanZ family protein [Myxococcaceae bacterium]